ncbi:MAG: S-layer homology domain-containing protein, partial [Spirochaetales bacterium]
MVKLKKCLIVLVLTLVPFCLGAAGLKEAYNCGQAAQLLQINADAYQTPAPTAEEILGGLSPYAPLTHMEGCEMILRAFGPLPDVQEGVRYLIKYRDCAFTDVPQEGKEAVDNLVNAGLYIPKDNTVFGPNQLMTEEELAVLIDRIHAYLQSSPKDDFYSWATAEVLNNPIFLDVPYDVVTFKDNIFDSNKRQVWMLNVLNDCLKNPDTPEKRNIAAVLSTYMDQEEREKSMTYIQPLVDAIWNAPDY